MDVLPMIAAPSYRGLLSFFFIIIFGHPLLDLSFSRITMLVPANKHGNTAPHDVEPCLLFIG
uniref:Uncharacterized protein n=1 Tax=Rhizophora mucronata TaxID=61149 RepID=A0A2P2PW46_RHIMU